MAASSSTPEICCTVKCINPPETYPGYPRLSYVLQDPYVAFNNIPYAAPPEGLERCQGPKSLNPGETAGPSASLKMCIQPIAPDQYAGSIDCLYLNIYLPKKPEAIEKLLPVLVFIHGGGFTQGCNAEEIVSPDFIVQHELVFVTLNYRLGAVGFLNMETDDVPGNAGLKDQVKALEWIRDNIICFKGDPKNVTISGQSAGGTSVNHHLISEQSKDLFHKAIVQSGGVYCPWGYRGHQRERKEMLLRDEKFNELLVDPNKSEEFQKRTAYLVRQDKLKRHPEGMSPYFGPTVEKRKKEAFIPNKVETMMEKLIDFDKPVMAGITKEEGLLRFLHARANEHYKDLMENDETFCRFLMDNLRWSQESAKACFGQIKQKYFPEHLQKSQKDRDYCFQNLIRDIFFRRFYDNFKFGPDKTLPKQLYVYRFDHVSEISGVKYTGLEHLDDATHGDEVMYLYCPLDVKEKKKEFIYGGKNPEIREVINHMCSLWANFCKDGVPKSTYDSDKVQWRCHTEDDPCFLSISKNLRLIEGPLFKLFKEEWAWLNALVSTQPILPSPGTPEGPDNFSKPRT